MIGEPLLSKRGAVLAQLHACIDSSFGIGGIDEVLPRAGYIAMLRSPRGMLSANCRLGSNCLVRYFGSSQLISRPLSRLRAKRSAEK